MDQAQMNIGNQINNIANSVTDAVTNTVNNVQNAIGDATKSFSSPAVVDGSPSFVQSNGLIAKFVFLILVLIVFFFLVNLGVSAISYFMRPNTSPYIISGMVSGNSNIVISQDPRNSDSIMIQRSNNQRAGIEMTWSVWLLVSNINLTKTSGYQHIFNKGGNGNFTSDGLMGVNNAPGLYLINGRNSLFFLMDTINPDSEQNQPVRVEIDNIPLNKWFHVAVRIQNSIMDIYINGIIDSRTQLNYLPKQNYDNIFVGQNGGFQGFLSNLRYYDYACNITEINRIVSSGPNTNTSSLASITKDRSANYLSHMWYS